MTYTGFEKDYAFDYYYELNRTKEQLALSRRELRKWRILCLVLFIAGTATWIFGLLK